MKKIIIFAILSFLISGCATTQTSKTKKLEFPKEENIKIEKIKYSSPGSLWVNNGENIFSDMKACNIGDILTVTIYEKAEASKEASTATGRSSSISAGFDNFFGLEGKLPSTVTPSSLTAGKFSSDFSGKGSTSRKEDLIATISAQVVEIFPNGNMRIQGKKAVEVNNETQYIKIAGIVRPTDIDNSNSINSNYILNAKISYTGKGVISENQSPGWLVRLIKIITPL